MSLNYNRQFGELSLDFCFFSLLIPYSCIVCLSQYFIFQEEEQHEEDDNIRVCCSHYSLSFSRMRRQDRQRQQQQQQKQQQRPQRQQYQLRRQQNLQKVQMRTRKQPDKVAALIDAIYVQERNDNTDEQCKEAKAAWDALTDAQKATG